MLLVLTGSSCAGKSTLAFAVADRFRDLAVHDFDEVGVPAGADRRWRQRTMERWVRRALEYQGHGVDLLLTAQSPLGEILAVPSATLLDGIAVCLVDVADEVRRDRLAARDPGRWDTPAVDAFLGWAHWHRGHARDPRHRPDAIAEDGWPAMAWDRWTGWATADPRWRTDRIDTGNQPVRHSVDQVERWVGDQRDAHRSGHLPLNRGWAEEAPHRAPAR